MTITISAIFVYGIVSGETNLCRDKYKINTETKKINIASINADNASYLPKPNRCSSVSFLRDALTKKKLVAVITKSKKLSASVLSMTIHPVNQNATALIEIRNKTVIKFMYVERLRTLLYCF